MLWDLTVNPVTKSSLQISPHLEGFPTLTREIFGNCYDGWWSIFLHHCVYTFWKASTAISVIPVLCCCMLHETVVIANVAGFKWAWLNRIALLCAAIVVCWACLWFFWFQAQRVTCTFSFLCFQLWLAKVGRIVLETLVHVYCLLVRMLLVVILLSFIICIWNIVMKLISSI